MQWTTRHALPTQDHATFENKEYMVRVNLHKDSFEIVSVYNKKSDRTYRAERYTAKFMPAMAELVHLTENGYQAKEHKDLNETRYELSDRLAAEKNAKSEQNQKEEENNKMTNFIYYFRGHDRIRIEGTIEDRSPDGKYVHIALTGVDAPHDTLVVEARHLYDMDEINYEAARYVDCLDNATKWARVGLPGAVEIENKVAFDIRDQWSGEAVDLFDMAVDRIRRERYDAAQAAKIEEAEGDKSVLFQIGQLASGWLVTDHNFATQYELTSPDGKYSVTLHTEAGYGRNYFKVLHVRNLETGRKYYAPRYIVKHIEPMAAVSAELFAMFKIENYQIQLEGAN